MKKKKFRVFFALFLLFCFIPAFFCSACGRKEREKLLLVTEVPYAPYEYYQNGEIAGIDIDIAKAIAQDLDRDLEIDTLSFNVIPKALTGGYADIGISTITVTKEREKVVSFSIPYDTIRQVVVLPADSAVRTLAELKGKNIGVQSNTTADEYVAANIGTPVRFPFMDGAIAAVINGKVDGIMLDNVPAELLVKKHPNLRILEESATVEELAVAVGKHNSDLLESVNATIRRLQKDGTLQKIKERHWKISEELQGSEIRILPRFSIGIDPSFPPYETVSGGKITGISADVLELIGKELGFQPVFVEISSGSLLNSVLEQDVRIASASITGDEDANAGSVLFSLPFGISGQYALLKKGSDIRTPADLKGKRIGVIFGTHADSYAEKNFGVPERYSSAKLMIHAFRKGALDAVILDKCRIDDLMKTEQTWAILPEPLFVEKYGFAFSAADRELLDGFNRILQRIKQDGTLDRICRTYTE